jgi:hypothetical protein
LADEFAEISSDWSGELVDNTSGYTWFTAGTPVQISIPTSVPLAEYTMRMRLESPPYEAIAAATDCVNDRVFRGFAVGCLRFDGASTSESYDISGNIISVATTYKFTGRKVSWQYCWRPPLIARDGNGKERYYQGYDAAGQDYDAAKDGQPVYVADAVIGAGAWDQPVIAGHGRYAVCDFATVLGLPKMIGDG